jgi:hypothetical protein
LHSTEVRLSTSMLTGSVYGNQDRRFGLSMRIFTFSTRNIVKSLNTSQALMALDQRQHSSLPRTSKHNLSSTLGSMVASMSSIAMDSKLIKFSQRLRTPAVQSRSISFLMDTHSRVRHFRGSLRHKTLSSSIFLSMTKSGFSNLIRKIFVM